ncbi:MAG TPA: DUF4157 domain-containing protein [Kofleriaceae bacterium]|jgi:hypothetical protein|nr:DUF4157 domain-containing protein [Kofleriaceae bacterium]
MGNDLVNAGRGSALDGRAHEASSAGGVGPGKQTRVEQVSAVHHAAARGVATTGQALPFGDAIQRSFGRHDISSVQAHAGPEAAATAGAMGAEAYATGNHVVLGQAADLHTVAHEAAHVVQQRDGVQLKDGVGAAGDAHEQHADAVADAVVQGKSAEPLLDHGAGAAPSASAAGSASGAVQHKLTPKPGEAKVFFDDVLGAYVNLIETVTRGPLTWRIIEEQATGDQWFYLEQANRHLPRSQYRDAAAATDAVLRNDAITFGEMHPPPTGSAPPTEFNFPPTPEKPPTAPKDQVSPPPSSPFSFGSFAQPPTMGGLMFGSSQPTTGFVPPPPTTGGFTFGAPPPTTGFMPPPPTTGGFTFGAPPPTTGFVPPPPTTGGFTFGSSQPSTGFTPPPPTTGGFTFGSSQPSTGFTPPPPTTGGFTFGASPQPTTSAPSFVPPAKQVEDESEDEEEDVDPDKFSETDQHNHQVFMNNPLYAEMVAAVFAERGAINVRTSPAGGGKAGWRGEGNQISITSGMEGSKRASAMMFETTNAFHDSRSKAIDRDIESHDEDTYARAQEQIEYDGIRKHHEIMSHGVQTLGWPPELDRYAKVLAGKWSSFEGYLTTQEKTGHTNLHRSNFNLRIEKIRDQTAKARRALESGSSSKLDPTKTGV